MDFGQVAGLIGIKAAPAVLDRIEPIAGDGLTRRQHGERQGLPVQTLHGIAVESFDLARSEISCGEVSTFPSRCRHVASFVLANPHYITLRGSVGAPPLVGRAVCAGRKGLFLS